MVQVQVIERGSPWIISAVTDVGADRAFEVGEIIRLDHRGEDELFCKATGVQNIRAIAGWAVWKLHRLLENATADNPKAFPKGSDLWSRCEAAKRNVEEYSLCRVRVS